VRLTLAILLEKEVIFISFNFSSALQLNCLYIYSGLNPANWSSCWEIQETEEFGAQNIFKHFISPNFSFFYFLQAKHSKISKEVIDNSDEEALPPIPESPLPADLVDTPIDVEVTNQSGDNSVSLSLIPHGTPFNNSSRSSPYPRASHLHLWMSIRFPMLRLKFL
jgi:hypothetical protein